MMRQLVVEGALFLFRRVLVGFDFLVERGQLRLQGVPRAFGAGVADVHHRNLRLGGLGDFLGRRLRALGEFSARFRRLE